MKNMTLFILFALFSFSCELVRDNPLDIHGNNYQGNSNNGGNNGTSQGFNSSIEFSRYTIASKSNTSFAITPEQTIKAGETIYLQVYIKNYSSSTFSNVQGVFTTSSNLITIEPLRLGEYISFHNDVGTLNLSSGEGYGDITDGSSFSTAPNSNSYALKFTVANTANAGNVIPLNLQLTSGNNTKTLNFNLMID